MRRLVGALGLALCAACGVSRWLPWIDRDRPPPSTAAESAAAEAQMEAVATVASRWVRERAPGTLALRRITSVFTLERRRLTNVKRLDASTSRVATLAGLVYLPPSVTNPWVCQRGICDDRLSTPIDGVLFFNSMSLASDSAWVYLTLDARPPGPPLLRPTCLVLTRERNEWGVRASQRLGGPPPSGFEMRCRPRT